MARAFACQLMQSTVEFKHFRAKSGMFSHRYIAVPVTAIGGSIGVMQPRQDGLITRAIRAYQEKLAQPGANKVLSVRLKAYAG